MAFIRGIRPAMYTIKPRHMPGISRPNRCLFICPEEKKDYFDRRFRNDFATIELPKQITL